MSTAYDTPVRPVREFAHVHSGRYAHDRLPARPCADTPAWHLRNNNLIGLQVAFQCGTVHHNCSGVSLAKATDDQPKINSGDDTSKIDGYLHLWSGPLTTQVRYDLARNNLNGLDGLLYLASNDPTPGQ